MSLVEVVLALGIISFALVPVVGLLSVSLQGNLDSQRDTAIAFASRQMLGDLRGTYSAATTLTGYFDRDGIRCQQSDLGMAFSAEMKVTPLSSNPERADVVITCKWPPSATDPKQIHILYASHAAR